MGLTCLVIKRPWCVPFVSQREKKPHMHTLWGGKLFWDDFLFFSFWLCDSFACWWKIDVNHSPWLLSQHPFTMRSLFFCPDLLSQPVTPLLTILISFFYPLITFDMPPFFPLTAVSNKKCTCTIVSRTFKFWVLFNSRCPRFPMLRSPSCALWGHPE